MNIDRTPDDPTSAGPKGRESATEPALAEELKSMGQHLAAALRAAASTQEALDLRNDLRDGLRSVRTELDDALSRAPVDALKEKAQGPRVASVRNEMANAIRSLNRALDRLAASMERETDLPGTPAEGGTAAESPDE